MLVVAANVVCAKASQASKVNIYWVRSASTKVDAEYQIFDSQLTFFVCCQQEAAVLVVLPAEPTYQAVVVYSQDVLQVRCQLVKLVFCPLNAIWTKLHNVCSLCLFALVCVHYMALL